MAVSCQALSGGPSCTLKSAGYSNGCSGNTPPENMTQSRANVCKHTGDAKTCFVHFRVETFNLADFAPTVQSRRDRDKKDCVEFMLIIWFDVVIFQTVMFQLLVSFGVSAISWGFYISIHVSFCFLYIDTHVYFFMQGNIFTLQNFLHEAFWTNCERITGCLV